VRDEISAQILESLDIPNVVRAADLGWLWNVSDKPEPVSSPGFLGVSLRNPQTSRFLPAAIGPKASLPEKEISDLAESIDAVAISTGLSVRFISFNKDEDARLHQRVAGKLKANSEVLNPDLGTLEQCFNGVEAIVTMRYHAGLIGALKGAAVVCLPFSKKLDSLISGLGSAASKSTGDDLVSVVEKVLSGRSELNERIEELQSRSYKNVEIIELLDEIK
jgi:polysaccharide pyruvyl transferase WcaK-like protein